MVIVDDHAMFRAGVRHELARFADRIEVVGEGEDVATSVAAEGMSLIANEELLVADEPQDFADAVVRLYQDPALWAQISANGYENVRKHFSRATAKAALAGLLNFQKKL